MSTTTGSFNPNLAGHSVPLKINNMKVAQMDSQQIISLKNHKRSWAKVLPKYSKTAYKSGDELIFDLKPSLVDYINMKGAFLVATLNKFAVHAHGIYIPYGAFGLMRRMQINSGIYPLCDIDKYGLWSWNSYNGTVNKGLNYMDCFIVDGNEEVYKQEGNIDEEVNFRIPLLTPFDGIYLPVYNLGEPLELKITLGKTHEFLSTADDQQTWDAGDYSISNVSLYIDGLTVLSGGERESKIFQFHSIIPTHYNFPLQNQNTKHNFYYGQKNTSIKSIFSFIHKIINDPQVNLNEYGSSLACVRHNISMGGINYPYESGLTTELEMYYAFERFFNRYDSFLEQQPFKVQYEDGWDLPSNHSYAGIRKEQIVVTSVTQDGAGDVTSTELAIQYIEQIKRVLVWNYLCMNFDKLDQSNTIISGLDNERYSIVQSIDTFVAANNDELDTWLLVDKVFQIVNGQFIIND